MGKGSIPTPTYYLVINAFLTHMHYKYGKCNSPILFFIHTSKKKYSMITLNTYKNHKNSDLLFAILALTPQWRCFPQPTSKRADFSQSTVYARNLKLYNSIKITYPYIPYTILRQYFDH